jgi:hypothetical protein
MTARRDLVVRAPAETVAWAALYGWVLDPTDLRAIHRAGDLVLLVEPSGHITGLSGLASLAALVRVDRDLQELAARLDRVVSLLGEAASEGGRR